MAEIINMSINCYPIYLKGSSTAGSKFSLEIFQSQVICSLMNVTVDLNPCNYGMHRIVVLVSSRELTHENK